MIRAAAALLIAAVSIAAFAQQPAPTVRLRGSLDKVDGQNLVVRTKSGETTNVRLGESYRVIGVQKAGVADIGSGKFIGTTTVGERQGALVAMEVHIFPEDMRGVGEGHYDWDTRPDSKMTNGNVATVTNMAGDRAMTVQYKGGEKKILVTNNTVVVLFVPRDKSELKPGVPLFVVAQKQPDGGLAAARVYVGLDGLIPPM